MVRPSRRCSNCNQPIFSLPGWARDSRDRPLITRRRVTFAGVALALLIFILWLNYPFLPNYGILLFNRPTTDITSNSTYARWNMAGGDLAQRNVVRAPGEGVSLPVGRLKWSAPTGEGTRAGPIAADGMVYQGAYFRVEALDANTGASVWSQPASGPVQATLALAGDYLYAGFLDHRLRALDPESGQVIWEFKAGDIITTPPSAQDGILYFGAWDNIQYALDAATGEVIWTYEASDKIGSSAAVSDGVMALADKGGRIHLLDARTGQNRLVFRIPKSANSSPVIAHDQVYFAAGGRLYAIDATVKEVPGQYQFKRVWAQLWLWQIPGVPRPASQQGSRWRFSPKGADSNIVGAPAVTNSRVYVGDLDGGLYALAPATGDTIWRFQAEGGIYASPLVVADTVFVATQEGKIHAVDADSGEERWVLEVGSPVNEPLAFADGVLYLRTAEGTVHAVE